MIGKRGRYGLADAGRRTCHERVAAPQFLCDRHPTLSAIAIAVFFCMRKSNNIARGNTNHV
jgi:hypothetical protein